MSGINPVPVMPPVDTDSREFLLELNERLQTISDNFKELSGGTSGPAIREFGGRPPSGSPYAYVNPIVDAFQFLDPLYDRLRTAQQQVDEAMMLPNSVGQNQLQIDSVIARHIVAHTITADKMDVNELSAIVANLGTITAGNMTLDSSGFIRGGATGYNTGTGFWMGYDSAAYKFFIGTAAGNKLLWDGSALTITGAITATSGTIGGWTIGATTLTGGNATLGSTGVLTLGTSNDVVIASAVDTAYRIWAGHATAASAPFSVTKAGALSASGATISGTITSTSGSIGGFSLDSTRLYSTAGTFRLEIDSTTGALSMRDSSNNVRGQFLAYSLTMQNYYNSAYSSVILQSYITGGGYGRLLLYTDADVLNTIIRGDGVAVFGGTVSVGSTLSVTGSFSASNFSGSHSGTSSGTNTGDQTLPTRASLGLDTGDTPTFAGVNVTSATVGAGGLTLNGGVTSGGNSGLNGTYTLLSYTQIQIDNGIVTNLL